MIRHSSEQLQMDIKGFLDSIRRFGVYDTFYSILLRHVVSRFLKYSSYSSNARSWLELLLNTITKNKFIIIILASTRYDVFNSIVWNLFHGDLIKAKTAGTYTKGWMNDVMNFLCRNYGNNIRFFHNPLPLFPHNWTFENTITCEGKMIDYKIINYGSILMPKSPFDIFNEILKIGLSDKNIIYLMNSHFPWIVDMELSRLLLRDAVLFEFTPRKIIKDTLKKNRISSDRLKRAYWLNLIRVLKAVHWFLSNIDYHEYTIVITSDHGDLLGEYGLYLHPHYQLPQLYIVPWFEVSKLKYVNKLII